MTSFTKIADDCTAAITALTACLDSAIPEQVDILYGRIDAFKAARLRALSDAFDASRPKVQDAYVAARSAAAAVQRGFDDGKAVAEQLRLTAALLDSVLTLLDRAEV